MAEQAVETKGFEHFLQITESFKVAGASAEDGDSKSMKVVPFLDAMTMFLRIFDAFSNPFFSDVVKKDVVGNINVRILSRLQRFLSQNTNLSGL